MEIFSPHVTCRELPSMFFTHLLACPCGSIARGHLGRRNRYQNKNILGYANKFFSFFLFFFFLFFKSYRRESLDIIAFSAEKVSDGRPAICHSLSVTGSPSASTSEYSAATATPRDLHSCTHFSTSSAR